MDFTGAIAGQFNGLPDFWWLWLIAAAGITAFICGKRKTTPRNTLCLSFLAAYVLFILFETVIGRPVHDYQPAFMPFWSYADLNLRTEIILNYILFIPLGFLLYAILGSRLGLRVVFIGLGLSVCIEVIQLVMNVGLFEFDDIFGNTIGCLIGAVIGKVVCRKCGSKIECEKMTN